MISIFFFLSPLNLSRSSELSLLFLDVLVCLILRGLRPLQLKHIGLSFNANHSLNLRTPTEVVRTFARFRVVRHESYVLLEH